MYLFYREGNRGTERVCHLPGWHRRGEGPGGWALASMPFALAALHAPPALSCQSAAPQSSQVIAINAGPLGKMSIKRSGLLKKLKS